MLLSQVIWAPLAGLFAVHSLISGRLCCDSLHPHYHDEAETTAAPSLPLALASAPAAGMAECTPTTH